MRWDRWDEGLTPVTPVTPGSKSPKFQTMGWWGEGMKGWWLGLVGLVGSCWYHPSHFHLKSRGKSIDWFTIQTSGFLSTSSLSRRTAQQEVGHLLPHQPQVWTQEHWDMAGNPGGKMLNIRSFKKASVQKEKWKSPVDTNTTSQRGKTDENRPRKTGMPLLTVLSRLPSRKEGCSTQRAIGSNAMHCQKLCHAMLSTGFRYGS